MNAAPTIPSIANIHQRVFAAASAPGALNMRDWHTCDTTHCRAGWVIALAGKDGHALEAERGPVGAAMAIYRASSPLRVAPTRFFETDEQAMGDMQRMAAEEEALASAAFAAVEHIDATSDLRDSE